MPNQHQDARGKFAKGNTAALGCKTSGNPQARLAYPLRKVMLECVTPDVLRKHMLLLIDWIEDESLPIKDRRECMEMLHNRVLGKPKETLEVQHDDGTPVVKLDNLSAAELDQFLQLAEKAALPPQQLPPVQMPVDAKIIA